MGRTDLVLGHICHHIRYKNDSDLDHIGLVVVVVVVVIVFLTTAFVNYANRLPYFHPPDPFSRLYYHQSWN